MWKRLTHTNKNLTHTSETPPIHKTEQVRSHTHEMWKIMLLVQEGISFKKDVISVEQESIII